jgi:hypothetical protein
MARVITGRIEIRVNGQLMLNKPGAKALGIGGFERKPVMGDTGLHGETEEPSPASCEFTMTDTNEVSLDWLGNVRDATLTFEAANNGKVYVLRHAFCKNNLEVTAGEGEVPVIFYGPAWEEQMI